MNKNKHTHTHSIINPLFVLIVIFSIVSIVGIASHYARADTGGTLCCVDPQQCYSSDDYSGNDFTDNCIDGGGTVVDGDCSQIPQCVEVCCCPTTSDNSPIQVTDSYCSDLIASGQPYTKENAPSQDETCDDVCPSIPGGGGGGQTGFSISGTVKSTLNQPLGGAIVTAVYGSNTKTTTTSSSGAYIISELPIGQVSISSKRPDCTEETESVNIQDSDITQDFTLNCLEGCTPSPLSSGDLSAMWVKLSDSAKINIDLSDMCPGWLNLRINRYKKDSQGDMVFLSSEFSTGQEYIDSGLSSGTEYCYTADIIYPSGNQSMSPSDAVCLPVADEECIHPSFDTPEFCEDNARASCNSDNQVVKEDCGSEVCYVDSEGLASCKAAVNCQMCNGLFGLFGKLNLQVSYNGREQQCSLLESTKMCLYDRPPEHLVVDKYRACTSVHSCIDYRSPDACSKDSCSVGKDGEQCTWHYGAEQLGKGVCSSGSEIRCEMCEELNGYCTKNLCEQISMNDDGTSNCYFKETANMDGLVSQCISKENLGCRMYETQEECIGDSSGARVDITYDSDDNPVAGTNKVSSPSHDAFGLGVCDWNAEHGYCYKNADNWKPADIPPDDDCYNDQLPKGKLGECNNPGEQCYKCLGDAIPPTTTLNIDSATTYTSETIPFLPYTVEDNKYEADDIQTLFCITQKGSSCYPDRTINTLVVDADGDYTIYYYSVDPARNFEEVKSADISVVLGQNPVLVNVEEK